MPRRPNARRVWKLDRRIHRLAVRVNRERVGACIVDGEPLLPMGGGKAEVQGDRQGAIAPIRPSQRGGARTHVTATRRTIPRALLVCALTPAVLSACTGPDAGMGFGPDGPIPPAPIGSSSTYGAPVRVGNPVGRVSETEMAAAQASQSQPLYQPNYAAAAPAEPMYQTPTITASETQQGAVTRGALLAPPSPSAETEPSLQTPAAQSARRLPRIDEEPGPSSNSAVDPSPGGSDTYSSDMAADSGAAPMSDEGGGLAGQPTLQEPPTRTAALQPQGTTEVQFLPLVGAPDDKANILARSLSDAAANQRVVIRPAADGRATLRLKGYFSTFEDGGDSVLVYVWDVLDENDQRIHRIQGQERFATSGGDAWAGVDKSIFDKVAAATLQEARAFQAGTG